METLAVYEEHPIRTYGLKAQEGLCWLNAGRPLAGLGDFQDWGLWEGCPRPVFLAASLGEGRLRLGLCLAQADLPALSRALAGAGLTAEAPARPVSLIHLQGPHFGDRYGIAAAALAGLAQAGVTPLGLGAVVHSLFLVVEPDQATTALEALSTAFSGPDRA